MRIKHHVKTAYVGLKTNKARTALTILGIVIGVTAIIAVMSLGRGAQNLILREIQGMGSKTIMIMPGRQPEGPSDFDQTLGDSLRDRDIEAIKSRENVPHLGSIMPMLQGGDSGTYGNETYRLTIYGATDLITKIFDLETSQGAFFTDEDVKNKSDVIVIGSKVKEELFGQTEALGKKIRIKGRNFRVVGILPKKGQVSLFNFDKATFIPYTTAQQYVYGVKYYHAIIAEADSDTTIEQTVHDIERTLRDAHGMTDPKKDDFFVQTQEDLSERVSTITNILTFFLIAVAAISLLVGGIGIMNIMLVSVTERTREIGLRKALGATEKNIMSQFIIESVILTSVGGIVGILLGAIFSFLVSYAIQRYGGIAWQFEFPISAVMLGLGVSGTIGLAFGLYPARKAAIKNPIDALRYE